jgi:outer membrane protein OmpA-like peptidoglycan-associated protein
MRAFILAGLFCFPALAQEEEKKDAEGCKDSPLVSRMPGSFISSCDEKEYDEAKIRVKKEEDEKSFEGAVTRINYDNKKGQSALQIIRNYENALKRVGFQTLFQDEWNNGTTRVLTMQKTGKGGATINVEATTYGDGSSVSQLVIVRPKEMEQEIAADASALLEELKKSGHVAVYGINFETGKSAITDDSAKQLGEVAKLLKDNADLKLRVEGHTDNVGKSKENLELSKKRAAAVKDWLTKNGVEAGRLTTDGFGDKKPVADNSSEEGRAKNRRVELVKI